MTEANRRLAVAETRTDELDLVRNEYYTLSSFATFAVGLRWSLLADFSRPDVPEEKVPPSWP